MSNLYLISQAEVRGYDTYDSAVVCTETEEDARNKYPGIGAINDDGRSWPLDTSSVTVKYLGKADDSVEVGVICASFNAG